jgi:hypothetical protein
MALASRNVVHPPVEFHVFPDGEVAIHAGLLEHHANLTADVQSLTTDIKPATTISPWLGWSQGREHPNGGGLTGSIWPQQAKHFPRLDGQDRSLTTGHRCKLCERFEDNRSNHGDVKICELAGLVLR